MITEKDTIRCEAVFNDDKTHRLMWKQVWNKDKPMACVIMLNPSMSDTIICDLTTSLVVNNIVRLEEYGGVFIVNLFTILTPKLQMRFAQDTDINDYENDNYILKCCEQSSEIILAWGCGAEKNVRISNRIDQVLTLLSKHKEKFRVISDGRKSGIHPLTPSCREKWILEVYNPEYEDTEESVTEAEETATDNNSSDPT
ncbi:MAG: DUF1643 domain-containing protein [Clostridia bacterium]|nr:DUF1643 domain-containing protein [Clostridia bacterium]